MSLEWPAPQINVKMSKCLEMTFRLLKGQFRQSTQTASGSASIHLPFSAYSQDNNNTNRLVYYQIVILNARHTYRCTLYLSASPVSLFWRPATVVHKIVSLIVKLQHYQRNAGFEFVMVVAINVALQSLNLCDAVTK